MSKVKVDKLVHGFKTIRSIDVPELRTLAIELVHLKTSAKYLHLKREDANKAFSVQFRTTPTNDSGISHILEHTVLCGSKKYPVRDPFFKMLQRSQANFMNALTASDWTMYPFATMNETDFENLFHVYTDAVFNPKLNELDFMQEGWRLEPASLSEGSPLRLKGVVFNEMKGVFSNSLNRFAQTVQNKLMPETYGFVSGGHPDSIPTLTWNDLKEFHKSCYHPSNASFYTYGDSNLEWCLERLNTEYLEQYETITLHNSVPLEPTWDKPRSVQLTCEPDPMAPDPDRQCTASLSYRLEDIRNVYPNFVLNLLSKLLIDGDNAPLYQGLIESGYALDWAAPVCGMDQGARTTSFHVGVQGVRLAELDQFSDRVRDILNNVVRNGIPEARIEAVLHQYELAVRHESAQFGLNLIMGLSHAVNHEVDLEEALHIRALIDRFNKDWKSNPNLLLDMMQKYLLGNPHRLLTNMRPDSTWQEEQSKHDAAFQSEIVSKVSPEEKEQWISKNKVLQEQQQNTEDISCLPCLQLYDIPMECRREPFTMTEASGCPVQLNEAPTNDLVYFHGLADLGDLHQELLQYVPLFCELFPRLGADGLTYSEMDQAIDLHTGGLHVTPHVTPKLPGSTRPDTSEAVTSVHLSGYCLESKIPSFFELWSRLFRAPCWSDVQRLITLILMSSSGEWSANAIADSAHHFAMRRAAANLSASSRFQELWNGLEQGLLVKRIASRLGKTGVPADATVHQLTEKMTNIWRHISVPARLKFSLHGEPDGLKVGLDYLQQFVKQLTPLPLNPSPSRRVLAFDQLRSCSYFVMPYTVHYVAKALPAPAYDSSDYASYRVLSHLLTSKFLHREIREKGGAYGGRAITRPESMLLFSYRDPNALRTVNVFENALDWAETAEFPAQDVNEAKLAVFQELDKPVSAGSRGLTNFLLGISDELRQTQRTQLFKVEAPALRSAASQLLHNKIRGGCVILGPQDSTDWPREQTDQDPAWEKIFFME